MAQDNRKSPVSFDVGAKATFEAKVTTEIPRESSGRLLDALTDLLRPISERRGLRADQIRLQREQILIEIASKARERLAIESLPITPVPNKFMVPFLERASLEEMGTELSDRWADLLVSAATDYQPSMIRFSGVLSEIGSGEVSLLDRMVYKCRSKLRISIIEDTPVTFMHGILERIITNIIEPTKNASKLSDKIIKRFEPPGSIWPFLGISRDTRSGGVDIWEYPHPAFDDRDDEIASNLVSLGVLNLLDGVGGRIGSFDWFGRAYGFTKFGLRFFEACDLEFHKKLADDKKKISDQFSLTKKKT